MPLRERKPTTPGQRGAVLPDFSDITRSRPEKALCRGMRKKGGRNNTGRITCRHRGGGHRKRYRQIDFRGRPGMDGKVLSIEYDPNRSARIALLQYPDGVRSYVLAPSDMQVGRVVQCGETVEIRPGNRAPLKSIPDGTTVFNIELTPGKGAQMVRAAGTGATVMAKGDRFCQVRLPSGETRLVPLAAMATIGQVGNADHKYISSGKAGRTRWRGRRSSVRGIAMNPVDHPHGGGEGRSKGHQSQSPWGWPTKGHKTRNPKKPSGHRILERRK